MQNVTTDRFALIKPILDAHTLGINSIAELLRECGYSIVVGDEKIEKIMNEIKFEANQQKLVDWIQENKINHIGISYRLDTNEAVSLMGYLVNTLKNNNLLDFQGGPIDMLMFAGMPKACEIIEEEHRGLVKTFKGGESASDTLSKLNVPKERIPQSLIKGSAYDDRRMAFGEDIIKKHNYNRYQPLDRSDYKDFGTDKDTVLKRLNADTKGEFAPLMRAHVGPYSSSVSRIENVREFNAWAKTLADTKFLDILSIGTSQLSQANFGEDWGDRANGGGVPINSPEEFRLVWEESRPLLLRTYAGTQNIPQLAEMYEDTINIGWHALSFWWFNELDERGPYDLYTNLKQHVDTVKYIATTDKPFEANVSHHFGFRGGDDVTYIVSAYLAAKLAKKHGIKTYILQNMLNTPRYTWGIQDLAKSRAMLELVKELEDDTYKVLIQPRAGLDYFKPDLDQAKIQLAAVSALMDDIDPHNEMSPPIIHVVSYSEASHLATPDVINESIQITQTAIQEYRKLRESGQIEDMSKNTDVQERTTNLLDSARTIIQGIESNIEDPYSAEGFYKLFTAGFLPVPYLWTNKDEFRFAKHIRTKPADGGVKPVDENNNPISAEEVVNFAVGNLKEVDYMLKQKNLDV